MPLDPQLWPHLNERCRAGRQAHPPRRTSQSAPCLPPWGEESSGQWRCSSRTHPPPLAVLCPRGTAWCVDSARAMATLIRSCRKNCLSRRSRRLRAALALSTSIMTWSQRLRHCVPTTRIQQKGNCTTRATQTCSNLVVVVVLEMTLTHVSVHTRKILKTEQD